MRGGGCNIWVCFWMGCIDQEAEGQVIEECMNEITTHCCSSLHLANQQLMLFLENNVCILSAVC